MPKECFNSQPRKGADVDDIVWSGNNIVSTHSPARGLTYNGVLPNEEPVSFNSQPRKGADGDDEMMILLRSTFQLTAPQGG